MTNKTLPIQRRVEKAIKWRNIAIEAIIAILIVVLLHTGISKLIDWRSFEIQMFQSPIFHEYYRIVTFGGPILEIIIALMLVIKRTRFVAFIASFLLMGFFTWYVYFLMTTIPNLPCSCGGVVGWLNWTQHLILNIFLTIISLIGALMWRNNRKEESKTKNKK
ncbi:MauE/DoxX family redox-associated membrane protein [Chitinophaga pollutisoli]|uniref:MauE/DoxX family redox-associated membrane protein n=1 Tax=Chitinophaga pollutisoli TaxID=3133966 RepID=A0ABZ2YS24_9BACT